MTLPRFVTVLALISVLAVSACANTIRGAGRDISNTADATAAAANDIVD